MQYRARGAEVAVHHGHHHGLDGLLLVLSALLLSRIGPSVRARWLRVVLGMYLALMTAYGLGNMANDFWTEQIWKRGWTDWQFPDLLQPAALGRVGSDRARCGGAVRDELRGAAKSYGQACSTSEVIEMGTIVVTEFVSLDGVFEDPGGSENYEYGGWTFEYDRGDEGNTFKLDELMDAKVQLLGRVTYEGFAEAWPSREGPFAEKLNNDLKVVVSTTLTDPQWNNTTVIGSNVVKELTKLRDETDGSILVAGSGTLVETLLANDLVDELRLMVFPTILGRGRRVFPDGIDRLKLKLVESRTVGPDGVQVQVYRRAA